MISLRLPADLRAAIDELRQKGDFSFGDILRVGLELLSPTGGDSYSNGVTFALAELYLITCDECQHTIMEFFDHYQTSQCTPERAWRLEQFPPKSTYFLATKLLIGQNRLLLSHN